jgi:hypothetical protein
MSLGKTGIDEEAWFLSDPHGVEALTTTMRIDLQTNPDPMGAKSLKYFPLN